MCCHIDPALHTIISLEAHCQHGYISCGAQPQDSPHGDTEVVFTAYKTWSSLINLVQWWNQMKQCVQTAATWTQMVLVQWCCDKHFLQTLCTTWYWVYKVEQMIWTSCNWFLSSLSPDFWETLGISQLLVWHWCQSISRDCVHKQLLFTFAREAKHVDQ